MLASLDLAPHALKVHRDPEPGLLIEIRMTRFRSRTIESIARRLCSVPSVASVAYRTAESAGWCVARQSVAREGAQAANSPGLPLRSVDQTLPAAS